MLLAKRNGKGYINSDHIVEVDETQCSDCKDLHYVARMTDGSVHEVDEFEVDKLADIRFVVPSTPGHLVVRPNPDGNSWQQDQVIAWAIGSMGAIPITVRDGAVFPGTDLGVLRPDGGVFVGPGDAIFDNVGDWRKAVEASDKAAASATAELAKLAKLAE